MNIGSSRPVVNVARVAAGPSTFAGTSAQPNQLSPDAALIARSGIDTARRTTSSKRGAGLAKLESRVRAGGYAPNPALVADEILADAEIGAGLKSLIRH